MYYSIQSYHNIKNKHMDKNQTRQSILFAPKINISAPKTNRLDPLKRCTTIEELFERAAYEPNLTNRDVALVLRFQQFEKISKAESLKYIESFCENNFEDLPLFLLYQLSRQFKFKKLEQRCRQELILQNFEQMNYLRMDLTKCSLDVLKHMLEEYRNLVLNLEIPGLQTRDLLGIVDDYCKINNIGKDTREKLQDNYVNCPLYDIGASRGQMRNSMIQTRNRKKSDVTCGGLALSPQPQIRKSQSSDCGQSSSCSSPIQNSCNYLLVTNLQHSLSSLNQKKQKLCLQMTDTLKYCQQNKTNKEIDRLINSLDHKLANMEKKISKSGGTLATIDNIAQELNKTYCQRTSKRTESWAPPIMNLDFF